MRVRIVHSSTACVLLEIGSVRILTDPVFDDGKNRYRFAPAAWATRNRGPAIRPRDLPPLDAVLVSHAHHADNLDAVGKGVLSTTAQVITSPAGRRHLRDRAIGLAPWTETMIFGKKGERIRVTATPARHGPWWLPGVRDVVGFALEWEGQKNGALYISGDTVFFAGIEEIAKRLNVGTALLHLGAVDFWPPYPPFIRFTFDGREAARTAKRLEAKTVIPLHYDADVWSHFKENRDSYRRAFEEAGVANQVTWLRPGEPTWVEV